VQAYTFNIEVRWHQTNFAFLLLSMQKRKIKNS
jgi:hypothetical protein